MCRIAEPRFRQQFQPVFGFACFFFADRQLVNEIVSRLRPRSFAVIRSDGVPPSAFRISATFLRTKMDLLVLGRLLIARCAS